jgi:hypothetical protein
MDGICENCHKNTNIAQYNIYYATHTNANEREAVFLPVNKNFYFKILGKYDIQLCESCIKKYNYKWRLRLSVITGLMVILGVFLLIVLRYKNIEISNNLFFFPAFFGCTGIPLFLLSLLTLSGKGPFTLSNPSFLAKKLKKAELKAAGANSLISQDEYEKLISNLTKKSIRESQASEILKEETQTPTLPCPNCGNQIHSNITVCPVCGTMLLDKGKSILTPISTKENFSLPQLGTAANLAIINAVLTIGVAIIQFTSGEKGAIIPGCINSATAISYFATSFGIRKGDPAACKSGLSMAKWGLLWVTGMACYFIATSGGIGLFNIFVLASWLLTDALQYLTLKRIGTALD